MTLEEKITQLELTNASLVDASNALTQAIIDKESDIDERVNLAAEQIDALIDRTEPYNPTALTQLKNLQSGWLRIAEFPNRGSFELMLALTGGDYDPIQINLQIFKNFIDRFHCVATVFGHATYVKAIRLQNNGANGTGDKTFVEIELETPLNYLNVQTRRHPVFDTAVSIYNSDQVTAPPPAEAWASTAMLLPLGVSSNLHIQ